MPVDGSPLEVAPRPPVDAGRAAGIARDLYGVEGPVRELGSQQDRNFLVETPLGGRVVLKVANRGWGRETLEAQNAALRHLASHDLGFAAPVPLPGLDGALLHEVDDEGGPLPVRLLKYVEGVPLSSARHLAPQVVAGLGRLAGLASAALAGFEHPGLDRAVQWDLRRADEVVGLLLPSIGDPDRRALVADVAAGAWQRLADIAPRLRVQAIHGDVTDDNVVGEPDDAGRLRPAGVIDFGDLCRSWLVADLAVAVTGVLRHAPDDPFAVLPAVRAFHDVVPLTEDDVEALWPLVLMRGAVLVASSEHQVVLDPDNPGLVGPLEDEWRILHAARSVHPHHVESVLRAELGLGPAPRHAAALRTVRDAGRLIDVEPSPVDLSVGSAHLHSGRFLQPGVEEILLAEEAGRARASCTRWGEARATRTRLHSARPPETVALGVELRVPPRTPLSAPWPGTVSAPEAGRLELVSSDGARLLLRGVHAGVAHGEQVARGAVLGTAQNGRLAVQVCVDPEVDPPALAGPVEAAGWLALCPDPSPLLGTDVAAPDEDADALLARRRHALAAVQESYYDRPMRIERGWRHHLLDTDARSYVDMVNNVTSVGHGHPHVADAVERQLRTLNTNSRFHYAAIAEFSERLAALAPDGLDQVFLVNSGSEAVDLALRMAQTVTGRQDVLAVREAYHGWTYLSDAVTTSLYDNPAALDSRPDWVHLASAPNPYRGRFRGPGSGAEYAAELRALVDDLVAAGRPPAAFVCEPLFGNAGGVLLPEGYLPAAYDAVRAAGGLVVADEVQVGYGRTGHHWWAFEMHGVTPDFITIAKAMGNGHPLGAVITTRAIAEAFGASGSFFSSAGGSPVSCVTGMTVLDVIEDEGLQANAATVGDHLRRRCEELAERHPVIGTVHGLGLYLGVELVRDRDTLEPATAECYAICERLRELGVVMQPTGERANVLKLKPPMCLDVASADFVVEMLEAVLRDGW
ncbi:MAG: aminotransferase [Frankiales bacterium]|nr:aminotransferase [Frankiales bacterium]